MTERGHETPDEDDGADPPADAPHEPVGARWRAVILAVFVPGAGQLHNGDLLKGLLLLPAAAAGFWLFLFVAIHWLSGGLEGQVSTRDLLTMSLGLGVFWLYGIADAYRVAAKNARGASLPMPRDPARWDAPDVHGARPLPAAIGLAVLLSAGGAAALHGFSDMRKGWRVAGAASASNVAWVHFPGGTFAMGTSTPVDQLLERGEWDQAPAHQVTLGPFDLARTLVTVRQYRACVAAGVCTELEPSCGPPEKDDEPAICADWDQARTFSAWVGGRLPTEAEWEYAATSGGKSRSYPWGEEVPTCELAAMNQGAEGCASRRPLPVCSKPKGNTEQGLCDMAGNAEQWVQDRFHYSYEEAPADGSAWETTGPPRAPAGLPISFVEEPGARNFRAVRGAAWDRDDAATFRTTRRAYQRPEAHDPELGFRPARSSGGQ